VSDLLEDQLQSSLGAADTRDRELGGGGMSRVFVAKDELLGRDVVMIRRPEARSSDSASASEARIVVVTGWLETLRRKFDEGAR